MTRRKMTRRKKKGFLGLVIGLSVVLFLVVSGVLVALPKAEIQVSNLVVEPRKVLVGDPVVVSADIKNTGGRTGDYQATLTVNGDVQETRNLEVSAESVQSVSFTVTPMSSGEYRVALGGLTGIFVAEEGILPSLYGGDLWTYTVRRGGEESEVSYEVRGETTMEGEVVYVIDFTWESPLDPFDRGSSFVDKGTLYPIEEEHSGTVDNILVSEEIVVNRLIAGSPWPLVIGNEWTVSWSENSTSRNGLVVANGESQSSRTFTVEGKEEVTTAVGDFRCFKVVELDETGNVVGASWYSDKIKREVRREVVGDILVVYELASYKVSATPPETPLPQIDIPSVTEYDNSASGYTISYPEGWELVLDEEEAGTIYIFTSTGAEGLRLAWLNVEVVSIEDALVLDEVQQEILEATEQTDPNFELVSSIKVAAELPWYQLEWNSSLDEVKLKGETIVAVKGQQLFVVTGWVQAAYSNEYGSALEGVIDSFGIHP
ncbi:MAG: hypothetical protein MUO17_05055 [Dehalococcoidales bacterium]|nr:hypothetical protein [Dehalococcoidales bacterium]